MNRKTFEAFSDTLMEFLQGAPDVGDFAERKRLLRGLKITFIDKDSPDKKLESLLGEQEEIAAGATSPEQPENPQGG
jgi:hypothetical protein